MSKDLLAFENVIKYISSTIRDILIDLPNDYKSKVEEIRLRNGKPLNINFQGADYFITQGGVVSRSPNMAYIVTKEEINSSFQLITNHSVYAYSEEIRKGFITVTGGHRIGLGGKIIYNKNGIENIRDISSLNIRIAREKKGISNKLLPYLIDNDKFYNSLIISPPQCGKTTLLRDLIRNLSNGYGISKGFKIGLIDERSEIAGVYNGMPQKDIGIRTDLLDGCFKADGIMMLIRSMSPEIIAVDEIGSIEDIEAIGEGLRAGIGFIATIHGHDLEDIANRINLEGIIREKVFKRYIILDNSMGVGTIKEILDSDSRENIYPKAGE